MMLTTPYGPVNIRPAQPLDGAQVLALRLESLAQHPAAFAADYELTAAQSAADWSQRIAGYETDGSGVLYLAEAPHGLVGLCGLGRGHWPKTRHSGLIWGVYVHADWRSAGVAQALLTGCLMWGQAHALDLIKLGVVTGNAAAIRCYTSFGFSVYGVEPKAIRYQGVDYDELLMVKSIGAGG